MALGLLHRWELFLDNKINKIGGLLAYGHVIDVKIFVWPLFNKTPLVSLAILYLKVGSSPR